MLPTQSGYYWARPPKSLSDSPYYDAIEPGWEVVEVTQAHRAMWGRSQGLENPAPLDQFADYTDWRRISPPTD